ncbi:MAG TPA: hypothetical protein VME86_01675 [Acidobacteriaceae bacterium]|nr:hypothetical protein [Acidobacteriaceae bacterium]
MTFQRHSALCTFFTLASLAVSSIGFAQFRPPYNQTDSLPQAQSNTAAVGQPGPQSSDTSKSQKAKPAASPPASIAPPSLLSQPAQPAKVTLTAGQLTIDAHNSTLAEILDQISHAAGMKISGLRAGNPDQRVFGTYGPGAPRAVLSDLLNGSGYNVLMLGTTPSGAPSELALSVRPTGGVPNPPPQTASTVTQEYQDDQIRPTQYPPQPAPPPPTSGQRRGFRSPEQILQELEQMRQRQQQQQN